VLGITTLIRLEHISKEELPTLVTVLDIVTYWRLVQLEKALAAMVEPEAAVVMMLVAVEQPVPPASVQLEQVRVTAAA
jgi:hypothetical protein